MCGRSKDVAALHVDHVISLAEGGSDEISNLAALCEDCNIGKSAYRFTDYRQMQIVPDNLAAQFKFMADDVTGDWHRYHLYLYFRAKDSAATRRKLSHTWTIAGTTYDTSSDVGALVERRRREEESKFMEEVARGLIAQRQRIVRDEEGLWRVEA
jgi:hypothetical protein